MTELHFKRSNFLQKIQNKRKTWKKKFRLWKLPRAFWATELFTPWTIRIFLYLVSSGIHFNFLTCPVDCLTQHNLKIAWRHETHFSVHRYIGVYIHKCVCTHTHTYINKLCAQPKMKMINYWEFCDCHSGSLLSDDSKDSKHWFSGAHYP